VGSSYYTSAQYQADILRASKGTGSRFVPISRFGIGLLSCFIVGDRVEISTLRQLPDGSGGVPLRLSIDGLHGFYTLQTPDLEPAPMPSSDQMLDEEPGYRVEVGTSIAIRFDPRKERELFNIDALLGKFLLCPPVPVQFRGRFVGGNPASLVEKRWCDPLFLKVSGSEPCKYMICIGICPIDVSAHSSSPDIRGQGFLAYIADVQSDSDILVRLNLEHGELTVSGWKRGLQSDVFSETISLDSLLHADANEFVSHTANNSWLSHNGIAVPTKTTKFLVDEIDRIDINYLDVRTEQDSVSSALISLLDGCRPQLSLSREYMLELPWPVYSETSLTLVKTLDDIAGRWRQTTDLIGPICLNGSATVALMQQDPLLAFHGPWMQKCLFERHPSELMTVPELIARLDAGEHVVISLHNVPDIRGTMADVFYLVQSYLAYVYLELSVLSANKKNSKGLFQIHGYRSSPISGAEMQFPPLAFVRFQNSSALRTELSVLNRGHPFVCWLLEVSEDLAHRFPAIFRVIVSELFERSWREWNTDAQGCMETINAGLRRLSELDPKIAPRESLFLKGRDFDL
jgi:hypothetical protein